jgi:hypothetical protein
LATQIAAGSASAVVINAGATQSTNITLSFTHEASAGAANAGGFALAVNWPQATNLAYAYATVDGTAIAVPEVSLTTANGIDHYTATLTASKLAGGAHVLNIFFKATSSAATIMGPYTESVNIWDGVTDTMWADASGTLYSTLTLSASDFADSSAALAGISVSSSSVSDFSPSTYAYNLPSNVTYSTGSNYLFNITTTSTAQSVSATFNDTAISLAATSDTQLTGSFTAVAGPNTLRITITAADRLSTQSYTISNVLLTSTNIATYLNSSATSENLAKSYLLTEDLTLTNTAALIGAYTYDNPSSKAFTGTFDGNGHTITLSLTNTNGATPYCGVFPCNRGTIKNVHVAVTINQTGNDIAGGLVAVNDYTGLIYHCYSTGTISSTGNFIGGLAGENIGAINECYSTVNITSGNTAIGGLVGNSMGGTITNCYARGSVTGRIVEGGLCGEYPDGERLNGIPFATTTITNCYSSGSVSSTEGTGTYAFFGYSTSFSYIIPTTSNCFFDSGQTSFTDSYATACTPTSMKDLSTFSAWDISDTSDPSKIWGIDAAINDGYPYLQYFGMNTVSP